MTEGVFLTHYQIGRSKTNLITMGDVLTEIKIREEELCRVARTVEGELRKVSLEKIISRISFNLKNLSFETLELFKRNLLMIGNDLIYFRAFDSWEWEEFRTSQSKTIVKIARTSRRFISIEGVWDVNDTDRITNYYSGGTFDEESYTITLGTALPQDNMEVVVRYLYQGWKGVVRDIDYRPTGRRDSGVYELSFELVGQ